MLLFATSHNAAKEAGLTTYHGKPCKNCGNCIRDVGYGSRHGRHCVECSKIYLRQYHKKKTESGEAKQYRKERQPIATQQMREWRQANPDKAKEVAKKSNNKRQMTGKRRKYDLARRYDLTVEQFGQMNIKQGHACAICHVLWVKAPQVDHDHNTGEVRGLLCGTCNRMIGLANDDMTLLRSAVRYLKSYVK